MLEQELVALAAAGGAAVVQAAGTDAWGGVRRAFARWFGRGDERREERALERLDTTAAELEGAGHDDTRRDQAVVWRTLIAARLEDLPGDERAVAAAELAALLNGAYAPHDGPAAGAGGVAVQAQDFGGVQASGGSIAALTINGGAAINPPPVPDPSRG
ncbi:hypothetical protein [Streptomyces sp. WAC06614]|uniref:hypothetical protein n=1 Tax=Streptomyces sp. WAC06614 TaxID=2487416 RepID=UPI000F78137B|nr:hypothetical protein [Streptomyces sp. WAC06614]RSS70279.1 hypothetical protein EF918_27485 [Streptomyces sp. WAC06614]